MTARCSAKPNSNVPVTKHMKEFFKVYRRLNIFLLAICICPFLQSKQTFRFVCHRKYVVLTLIVLLVFHSFMIYLSVQRLPPTISSLAYYRLLKLSQTFGSMYGFGFVVFYLLRSRYAHAAFFDELFRFDMAFTTSMNAPLNYSRINRQFWIDTILFSIYLMCTFVGELVFHKYRNQWRDWCFMCCEQIQQITFFIILFHMKNAINNLTLRYRHINQSLISINGQSSFKLDHHECKGHKNVCQQFECITHAFDLLARARDRLHEAFASSLLLIYTYNMFAIALSTFIVLSSVFYEVEHHKVTHLSQIAMQYLGNELPMIVRELYFTAAFHTFGHMVGDKTCNSFYSNSLDYGRIYDIFWFILDFR